MNQDLSYTLPKMADHATLVLPHHPGQLAPQLGHLAGPPCTSPQMCLRPAAQTPSPWLCRAQPYLYLAPNRNYPARRCSPKALLGRAVSQSLAPSLSTQFSLARSRTEGVARRSLLDDLVSIRAEIYWDFYFNIRWNNVPICQLFIFNRLGVEAFPIFCSKSMS